MSVGQMSVGEMSVGQMSVGHLSGHGLHHTTHAEAAMKSVKHLVLKMAPSGNIVRSSTVAS